MISCPGCREPAVLCGGGAPTGCAFCRLDAPRLGTVRLSTAGRLARALDRRGAATLGDVLGGFVVLGGHAVSLGPSSQADLVVVPDGIRVTACGSPPSLLLRAADGLPVDAGDAAAVSDRSRWLGGGWGEVTARRAAPTLFLVRELAGRHADGCFVRLTTSTAEVLLHTAHAGPAAVAAALGPRAVPPSTPSPGPARGPRRWGRRR